MSIFADFAASYARNHGLLVFADEQAVLDHVRAKGYLAIRTHEAPHPPAHSVWQPLQGTGKHGAARQLTPRHVIATHLGPDRDELSYAHTADGAPITVKASSFHRWQRKTKAERVK